MNHSGVSLMNFYEGLSLGVNKAFPAPTFKFPLFRDFYPSFTYQGEIPILFSFDERFEGLSSWVELMDGHAFLIPFLFSSTFNRKKETLILPPEARFFLPSSEDHFYYSSLSYKDFHEEDKKDVCYVFFTYFETITSSFSLTSSMEKLRTLAEEYERVFIVLNCILRNEHIDRGSGEFFEAIRTIPLNCHFLSQGELFLEKRNLERKKVIFIHDEETLLKNPWEEVSIMKNAFSSRPPLDSSDEITDSVIIYPGVKKQIRKHKLSSPALTPEMERELQKIIRLLKRPESVLDKNYRRLIRDLIMSLKKENKNECKVK